MYTIAQVAKHLKMPAASLRYYDKLGIVSPLRAENGYRYYSDGDLEALQIVAIMKYGHFSLVEIKAVMACFQTCDPETSAECNAICKDVLSTRMEALKESVVNLQQVIVLLGALLPMIDSPEEYFANQDEVREFARQIYKNVVD